MKNTRKYRQLTLSLILTACFFPLSLVTLAEIKEKISQQNQNQPRQPQPTPTPQSRKERSTWGAILSLFKRSNQGRNLGSRGVCLVSPGLLEAKNILWSDRPLFLWQGVSLTQEIRLYSPFNPTQDQKVIWRQEIKQVSPELTFQEIIYTGTPLEAGKTYDWEIFDRASKAQEKRSFQVMDKEKRQDITTELQSLETRLKSEQATDEEIAIEKANYFVEKQLWSDALQSMFEVKNSSTELRQKIQELLGELCNTSKVSVP
jgi:Domain of Unknown Function (DUF928)